MRFRSLPLAALIAAVISTQAQAGLTVHVNSFASTPTAGQWSKTDMRGNGTASVVDLTGQGGNLETNAPLPPGAARLTTGSDDADKAEVGIQSDFEQVSTIFDGNLSFGYSYFKASVASGNAAAAPSFKLTFYNAAFSGDGYVTLVYEPYWNQAGSVGSSKNPPTDQWETVSIDLTNGVFFAAGNGGFGQSGSAGPPLGTLADWRTTFNNSSSDAFDSASLVGLSMGVGTYNQGQEGYFDQVSINTTAGGMTTYDFGVAAVPEPSTLLGGVIGVLVVLGGTWRSRRRRATA